MKYYISEWCWDKSRNEYSPVTTVEDRDLKVVSSIFDSLKPYKSVPLIEMWEMNEGDNRRIAYKEI